MYDQRFYFAAYLALCSTRQHTTFYEVLAVLLDSIYQLRNSLVLNCSSLQNRDTPVRFRFIMQAPVGIEAERSEEHTSELQSHLNLVCRLLLEKKKKKKY